MMLTHSVEVRKVVKVRRECRSRGNPHSSSSASANPAVKRSCFGKSGLTQSVSRHVMMSPYSIPLYLSSGAPLRFSAFAAAQEIVNKIIKITRETMELIPRNELDRYALNLI